MDFPRMTPIEYSLVMNDISNIIKNVGQYNSGLADLLSQKLSKIHWHVQSIETELEVMEGINNVGTTTRSDC